MALTITIDGDSFELSDIEVKALQKYDSSIKAVIENNIRDRALG
jgi:hypothetical protein